MYCPIHRNTIYLQLILFSLKFLTSPPSNLQIPTHQSSIPPPSNLWHKLCICFVTPIIFFFFLFLFAALNLTMLTWGGMKEWGVDDEVKRREARESKDWWDVYKISTFQITSLLMFFFFFLNNWPQISDTHETKKKNRKTNK